MNKGFGCAALILLISNGAFARDIQGRLGLGYNRQFANTSVTNGVTALSAKYALTHDIAAEIVFGMTTATPGNSVTGIKLYKNVFQETNLNFYFDLGGGLLSLATDGVTSKSAFQFLGGFGVEFFIPGLESLGISMEAGASLDNATGTFAARTYGASFVDAGMHFYF